MKVLTSKSFEFRIIIVHSPENSGRWVDDGGRDAFHRAGFCLEIARQR